jgi:hypothetical protein
MPKLLLLLLEWNSIPVIQTGRKFHLCGKSDKFRWILMAIYGPAQDYHKAAFLAELCESRPTKLLANTNGWRLQYIKQQQRKIIKDIVTISHFCSILSLIALILGR